MNALVRSELRKIATTRLWWGLLIGALVYSMVQAGAQAAIAGVNPGAGQPTSPGLDTDEAMRTILAGSAFTGCYIFALVLGITGMTGEYRYQTITPTFLSSPRRSRVVVAKMVAHLLYGFGYAVAALVAGGLVGAVVVAIRGHSVDLGAERLFPTMGLVVVGVGLWALMGLGIGNLIRNQIAAILVGGLVAFLLEPLLTLLLHSLDLDSVGRWLPSNASTALTEPGSGLIDYLPWWAGGLVLVGYALVFAALGVVLSQRRDIT